MSPAAAEVVGRRGGRFAPAARTTRSGLTESWHFAAAAVVDASGRPVARVGDPQVATFLRSAAKPFQAVALLLAGGEEAFSLTDADLALVSASHGGTPEHAAGAAALLARGGFTIDDLECGAHPPLDRDAARALRRAGEEPTPLHNNCSGKHAGMLLACRLRGWPTRGYVEPDHPLQVENRARLARLAGVEVEDVGVAIDGCSVPNFHLPLVAAARAWAVFAHPTFGHGGAAEIDGSEQDALARVARAMAAAPEMVAGPGRFTTRLIAATGGRVIGKEGAEGYYAVAVRGPVALGMVLKVADGGERCRDGVVLELLRATGSLSGAEFAELEGFYEPELRNHRGLLVGKVEIEVEVEAWEAEAGAGRGGEGQGDGAASG